MTTRKTHTAVFKAQTVQQVLREDKILAQIAAEHGIHPNQISQWKATALQGRPTSSSTTRSGCINRCVNR